MIYRAFQLLLLILCATLHGWPTLPYFGGERKEASLTIMLAPAGDATHTGRTIHDSYERSVAMKIAQEIKQQLETTTRSVIISRFTGETLEEGQTATFANKLKVDLFVSINCYRKAGTPELSIFTLRYDKSKEFLNQDTQSLVLIPFDEAHTYAEKRSTHFAQKFYGACKQLQRRHALLCTPPFAGPFAPLHGLAVPAIGIDIGLSKPRESSTIATIIAQALNTVST